MRPKIHLYQPLAEGDVSLRVVDPDDVAYAQTCDEVGADAIHTRDKHLTKMGDRVFAVPSDRLLRDCARSNAVVMGISVSSAFAVTVTYASLRGLWVLMEKAFEGFCALPIWAKIVIVVGVIAIATRPKVREGAAARWEALCSFWRSVSPGLLDGLGQVAIVYQEAQRKAVQSKAELQSILPPPTVRTALQHARSVCLRSPTPVPLEELLQMKVDGYVSASRRERADLRTLLHSSGQFIDNESGEWMLVGVQDQRVAAGARFAPENPRRRRSSLRRRRLQSRPRRRKPVGVVTNTDS